MKAHELPQKIANKLPPTIADTLQHKEDGELQEHMTATYRNLRRGLAVISFVLPLFLVVIGKYWYGIALQNSMSAYYWAESNGDGFIRSSLTNMSFVPIKPFLFILAGLDGTAPMRSWFVGTLFVLGVFLYLYKGVSTAENILLNVAGLCALCVALFPMKWNCDSCSFFTLHGAFAIGAFVSIALVALFCSGETLRMRSLSEEKNTYYRKRYFWLGLAMLLFPFGAWIITSLVDDTKFIFVVEGFGIWTFAAYWWVKSNELLEKKEEIDAVGEATALASASAQQTSARAPAPADRPEKMSGGAVKAEY